MVDPHLIESTIDPELRPAFDRAVDAILDDPKAALRLKVLRATRRLMAVKGLDVSMDDVAVAAGIGRRTLFRHFDSRDALVADALSSALDWYDERISRSNPADRPLADWIADLALLNMEVQIDAGRGLWQLAATPDHELAPELAKVNVRRRKNRRASTVSIARAIWERAGGTGSCPPVIVDATAIALSSFTTRSMTEDFGRDVTSVAQSIGTMLAALVISEVKRPARAPRKARR